MNNRYPERDLIKIALLDLLWKQAGHQMKAAETYRPLGRALELDDHLAEPPKIDSYRDEVAPLWPHHVQWAKQELMEDGYIETYAPNGIWKLTAKGAEIAYSSARVCVPL